MAELEISIEFSDVISYASTHNGRPIVHRLSVRSSNGIVIDDVESSIEIDSLGTAMAEPWRRRLSQVGTVATVWDSVDVRLDANALYSLTDQREATLIVRVTQDEDVIADQRGDVRVLAANSWVWEKPLDDYALMLAAFVMPNHPSLRPVLDAASNKLTQRGEDSGLSGYQGGSRHVDAIVECIYEAVRDLGITYVEPPAAWDLASVEGTGGQRVRTPGEVLDERAATCLDTAVLFASLLENVGLSPIIALVPGHALVGFWRSDSDESVFPASVWPITSSINLVDDGHIGLFETTTVCGGADSKAYPEAVDVGRRRVIEKGALEGESSETSRFIDVVSARRRNRVLPIPARIIHPDGNVEIVEYAPQAFTINLLREAIRAEGGALRATLDVNAAPARVKQWKNSLLDLSLRNPLIKQRKSSGTSLGLMVPRGTLGTMEDLLQSGRELELRANPFVDANGKLATLDVRGGFDTKYNDQLETLLTAERAVNTELGADVFALRLRRIASQAKSLVQDTGNNNLFLAMGSLIWTPDGKTEEVRSPLILVPVTIKSYDRSRTFRLVIDEASTVTPNYSLAEKLLQDADFRLPKLIEPDQDETGIDIDGLLAYVRDEISKAKLQGFRVDETATLGFFDFSTYRLWRDLSDHWSTFSSAPLVNHLIHTPALEFTDPVSWDDSESLDELAAMLPVPTDGSQVTAVSRAMAGQTFVLQGPPGTGKSQTITNLLARALHSGKRVLFIAEKAPALNVVKDRLEAVGLGPFILNLHDKGLRPAAVRQQLAAVMDAAVTPDREGFDAAHSDLDRALPPLQRYPSRVHATGKFGESAYSARNKLLAQSSATGQSSAISLPIPADFLTRSSLEAKNEISRVLREALDAGTNAGIAAENPWSLTTTLDLARTDEITSLVGVIFDTHSSLRPFLETIGSLAEVSYLAGLAHPNVPTLAIVDAAAPQTDDRAQLLSALQRLDANPYPVSVVPRTIAAPLPELTAEAQSAKDSFFLGRKKKVAAAAAHVAEYLADGTTLDPEALDATLATIGTVQRETAATVELARSLAGLNIPAGWNPLDPAQRPAIVTQLKWIEYWVSLLQVTETPARARLREFVAAVDVATIATAGTLGVAVRDLLGIIQPTEASLALWAGNRTASVAFLESAEAWQRDAVDRGLTRLRRWATLYELLLPLREASLDDAQNRILAGTIPFKDADAAFERGFLEAVFARQLDDENLDTFDGPTHDVFVRGFGRASDGIRSAIPSILGADLIDARGFDSGVTIGAVGELKRELSRTRGGKPIRLLIKDHWNVISRLTPCVLASPDSVVRFVDADLEKFDLVVFDEASQIRVPHAIGALGRAKAAVIVGDSKQMPPTSIAEISAVAEEADEPDDDDALIIDEESILSESVQARVPDVLLAWHYRSEDESLIAFSNQQYYDGRLSSFPAASKALDDKGLSFVKVDGTFYRSGKAEENRTNPEEAKAIVDEIVRRLHHPVLSTHSIGVVTFNQPQQKLIIAMLEQLGDDAVDEAMASDNSEGLLIRNLEDVQGQERDVILFSVAFSKNARGDLPLNFGPLNRAGGERRLNVAVTRARRQVIVFCSFEPSDLKVESSSSLGLRHLRTYLELAKFGPESSGAVSSQIVRPPDRHRDEILRELRAHGLSCEPDVGLSDFKVDIAILDPVDPSRRILGILLDGATWRSRATVGDRDSLPTELLVHKMDWPAIERIWMPTWVRDRDGEIARILAAVAAIEAMPSAEIIETVPEVPDADAPVSPPAPYRGSASAEPTLAAPDEVPADRFPDIEEWREWPTRVIGEPVYLDELDDPRHSGPIHVLAQEIVTIEGPVAPERFAQLIGLAHGINRVVPRRVEEILAVPMPALDRDAEGFLFLAEDGPGDFEGWRKSAPGTGRDIDEVSRAELGNAMHDIAAVGLGLTEDDLIRVTAAAFGATRVTAGIRSRLELALRSALGRGILVERGEYYDAADLG
ncbi:DUF3320 domain-containing protein [soil metagenome]